ncbi:MAG TPA: hypothetical protein VHZ24_03275 [Pirellulales bacterium]|jgi:hypothetical protein|nr:hypothetical protein [Pirellulales bacterium]
MAKAIQRPRQIALFVEGATERGDDSRPTLATFIHKWLDPQLAAGEKVGIKIVRFQGVSNYLDDVAQKAMLYLDERRANFVIGLVDLYGIPANRVELSKHPTVKEKLATARSYIRNLIPHQYRDRFRQHFAVHEVESMATLLSG